MNPDTDPPRTDAFGNNLVKCYCPRCIVGVHDDIQLAAQYRKHAEWRERAEKAEAEAERLRSTMRSFILVSPIEFERMEKIEAEVERLKASVQHYQDQALHFQHAWEKVQAMYNKLIYTSTKPIEPQQDDK